ncbi:MAG: prolyl-tRNA synthetase associated domain-containing protein [Pseudomonadota bacterium]
MDDTLPRGEAALKAALADLGIDPPWVEHEAAFTVAQSQSLGLETVGLHTKNLFLKDKKGAIFLLTAPEDAEIDLKTVHKALGGRGRVSFGAPALLAETLGVAPGSVTPLGLINDTEARVRFFVHPGVAAARHINVHPLRNTATVTLTQDEFCRLLAHVGHPPTVLPDVT